MLKKIIILIILISGIAYFWWHYNTPVISEENITQSALIEYPERFNFRQSVNDCGPYTVAAVVRALTHKTIDSSEFAQTITWRLPNKYTLPWGMEKQLHENQIIIKTPNLKALNDNERITYLKQKLSEKKPVIILGERDGYEHYLTLFGFNSKKDEFYIYDSLGKKGEDSMTTDENGSLPGNITLSEKELLTFWRGGGMYGLYQWYAIVNTYQNTSNSN